VLYLVFFTFASMKLNKAACLKTLGLPFNASKSDIKKAYRQLALKYHPDTNQSEDGLDKFIEIDSAYDFLINPYSYQHKQSSSGDAVSSKAERIKKAQENFQKRKEKERLEEEEYFDDMFKGKKGKLLFFVSVFFAIVSVLLILDCIIPNSRSTEKVNSIFSGNYTWVFILTDDYKYTFPAEHYTRIHSADQLVTAKSFLFNEVASLTLQGEEDQVTYNFFNYRNYYIPLALLFLLPMFIFYRRRMKTWYTLLYMVSYYVMPFILIGFLVVNYRFLALLRLY